MMLNKTELNLQARVKAKASQGKQCAAFGCNARPYKVVNSQQEKDADFKFFKFPDDPGEVKVWCKEIKRQNGRDRFKVTKCAVVCSKHFEKSKVFKPPGGTRFRLIDNARPVLHEWNNSTVRCNIVRKPPA